MGTQHTRSTGSSPLEPADESSLLRYARAGDQEAFRQLVQRHQKRVFGLALQLTGQRADATELSLDTFMRLHAALVRIRNPAHLERWLLRSIQQSAGDWLDRQARLGNVILTAEPDEAVASGTSDPHASALDPGPEFTALVLTRVEQHCLHQRQLLVSREVRRPVGRRFILPVLIAAVVIASLLGLHVAGLLWPAVQPGTPEHVIANAGSLRALRVADVAPKTAAGNAGAASVVTADAVQPAWKDPAQRYTIIAMPLRLDAEDTGGDASVAAFHAALLDELRKVPGLTVLVPGVTAPPLDASQPADYLLTVTALEAATLSVGGVAFHVADGRAGASVVPASASSSAGVVTVLGPADDARGGTARAGQWPVEINVTPLARPASGSFTTALQLRAADAPLPASCEAGGAALRLAACMSITQLAARQATILRARMFPDAELKLQQLLRMRDTALSADERERALTELLGTQLRRAAPGLDGTDISAILALTGTMRADQRAQLWRSLRMTSQPDLVEPLLDSLRNDPDMEVRFEALATVTANYGADPRVRAAVDAASREDHEETVRMSARRALHGAAEWRTYLSATLRNTSLPYADRVAPLLLTVHSAVTSAETAEARSIVHDASTLAVLHGLVQEGWFDLAQADTVADVLVLLANLDNPGSFDLSVQVLQDAPTPAPVVPAVVKPAVPQISPANLAWLQSHRGSARVRRMLDDIGRGNPDPRLDAIVEQMRRAEQPQRGR